MSTTFRVTKVEGRSRTEVFIDGDLTGDKVQVAEDYCKQLLSLGKELHIFLRATFVVDDAGRKLLSRLSASGACLHAIGLYTSYILKTLLPGGARSGDSTGGTEPPGRSPKRRR